MIRTRLQSIGIVLSLLGLVACAIYNSNSADEVQYGPVSLDSSDPNFAPAYQILKNRCISCHTHSSWAAYTSDELWITDSKVIVKNDANGSPLIQQIQIGAMPQDGSIPANETQQLVDWINNMP